MVSIWFLHWQCLGHTKSSNSGFGSELWQITCQELVLQIEQVFQRTGEISELSSIQSRMCQYIRENHPNDAEDWSLFPKTHCWSFMPTKLKTNMIERLRRSFKGLSDSFSPRVEVLVCTWRVYLWFAMLLGNRFPPTWPIYCFWLSGLCRLCVRSFVFSRTFCS